MTTTPVATDATRMSTAPEPPKPGGGPGLTATARRWWRQLTSMRTALVLLFLLAVAAVPGSLFPQRNVNQSGVADYFAEHPQAAPVLDRLWAFDVYASPWFGAVYLLLFVSLVGCLVPRMRLHVRAMLRQPPDAPRHLDRLPQHATPGPVSGDPAAVAERIAGVLRGRRWRTAVRRHDTAVTVSAEKGFLRETGNLLFHFSLLAILIGVAWGAAYGFYGNRLLVTGPEQAFCTSLQQFDDYGLGSAADASDLPPLCLELVDFDARYLESGQAAQFAAKTRYTVGDSAAREYTLRVNEPLRLDDGSVYLVGHGYAPVVRYTDRYGRSQTSVTPFLPRDQMLSSEGAAVFPDANVNPKTGKRDPGLQMGFQGVYLPTLPENPRSGHSAFPTERDPGLVLFAYRGDLGLDAGIPRSVYSLDQQQIDQGRLNMVGDQPKLLRPGDKWTLDDGTTVEFLGTRQWITLQLRHDPGAPLVLVAGGVLLAGLLASLTVRRRRIWFRLTTPVAPTTPVGAADQPGRTIVEAGGLTRSESGGFGDEFAGLVARCLPDAIPPSGAKGD